ncbi:MAG: MATE family efflux transporter [Acidobacteriota bacterium]|nr:MATE family efflux transporter [Acidobacteriota bacterium]
MPLLKESRLGKLYLGFWRRVTTGSTNAQVFRAAVTIGFLASFAKLASVAKELLVARRFGIGSTIEAFLVAILIPMLAVNVVSGSFNIALIPTYITVRERDGREAAQRLLSGVTVWSLILLILITVFIILTAGFYLPWIASGFNQKKLDLTFQLLWVISPLIVLSGIANIWGAVLNAGERFALVALAPIITPAITVIVLLIKRDSIFALPVGMVIGAGCEMILLGIALKLRGISLRPRWHGFDMHLREVGTQFGPRLGANLLRSGSIVVDRSLAATLSPGSVAALNYGNRVVVTVLSVAGAALGSAITPYYSKMIARSDWGGVQHLLRRYLLLLLAISIPIVILLFVFAVPVVQLIFQRGSFRARDTQLVAHVQALYALQIPFYLGNILISRLLSSLLASKVTLWAAAINLTLNVILDVVFIKMMGVPGIALATSCASLATFSFVGYHSVRLLRRKTRQSAQGASPSDTQERD